MFSMILMLSNLLAPAPPTPTDHCFPDCPMKCGPREPDAARAGAAPLVIAASLSSG